MALTGLPTLLRFLSLFSNASANGVSVRLGAMQFTLTLGANSAAKLRVKPSKAPLLAATDA